MFDQFNNLPLNPHLKHEAISTEGYTCGDMSMYYSGCFVLHERKPVRIMEMDTEHAVVEYRYGRSRDSRSVLVEELRRFLVPQGIYFTPDGQMFFYNYVASSSYKKGLCMNHVEVEGTDTWYAMYSMVFDVPATEQSFRISPRLAVHNGKIYSFHNKLTVGSYVDGELNTPYLSIIQRYEESRNA